MARLYRPSIPVVIKCRVALRQLGEMWPDKVIEANQGKRGKLLAALQRRLADLLGCDISDLRLDHDPPLAARPKERRGLSPKTFYTPDANDPEHLFYRPHGTQFAGSHDVKTRIRGDNGQLSDIALIKKNRRIERGPKPKRPSRFSSPPMRSQKSTWPKRPFNRSKK